MNTKLNQFEEAFHKEYHSIGESAKKRREGVLHGEHKILRNLPFVIAAVIVLAMLSSFLLVVIFSDINQYDPSDSKIIRTGYFVENLKGDTMDVSFSWRVPNDRAINVAIFNAGEYPEKINLLKEAIISENFTEIPDERPGKDAVFVYYDGWKGAIQSINVDDTKIDVPQNFDFIESDIYEGDISVTLSSLANINVFESSSISYATINPSTAFLIPSTGAPGTTASSAITAPLTFF